MNLIEFTNLKEITQNSQANDGKKFFAVTESGKFYQAKFCAKTFIPNSNGVMFLTIPSGEKIIGYIPQIIEKFLNVYVALTCGKFITQSVIKYKNVPLSVSLKEHSDIVAYWDEISGNWNYIH